MATGRRKLFRGWWIVAASFVSLALVNGIAFWSFGLFIEPLEEEFGWSRAQVALGFSLSLGLSGLTAPLAGRWIDKRGPRSAIFIGAIAVGLTYVLLATTQSLWQWYLYLALNGLLRHFVFIIPFMALIARWFDRRRSVAASILATGLMVGGMVFVPVVRAMIDGFGWRTAFAATGITLSVSIVILLLTVIRDSPAAYGLEPDGDAPPEDDTGEEEKSGGLTLREALHTRLFWALAAAMTLFPLGMVTWMSHSAPFYEWAGLSADTAALLISLSAGLAIVPRLLAGHFADRLPKLEYGAAGVAGLLTLAMAVLAVDHGPAGIIVFFPIFVLGFALGGALFEALLLPRAFGVQHYATILGFVVILQTVGMVTGPTLGGAIYDATGSYDWVVRGMMAVFVATGLCFLVAARLPRPSW